ncbi:MAG: hypothetical protein ACYC0V_00310 [Armatimonadota bacterium]
MTGIVIAKVVVEQICRYEYASYSNFLVDTALSVMILFPVKEEYRQSHGNI